MKKQRRKHSRGFKARVALEAVENVRIMQDRRTPSTRSGSGLASPAQLLESTAVAEYQPMPGKKVDRVMGIEAVYPRARTTIPGGPSGIYPYLLLTKPLVDGFPWIEWELKSHKLKGTDDGTICDRSLQAQRESR